MFFDSSKEEAVNFEPMPQGYLKLRCLQADYGSTQTGGEMLTLKFGWEQDNRVVFHRFNLVNANETAQKIGRGQLKHLCELVGREQLNSPNDLVGCEVYARIGHREYQGNINAEVKGFVTEQYALKAAENFTPLPVATSTPKRKRVNQTMSAGFASAPKGFASQPAVSNASPIQKPVQESDIPFGQ